MWVVAERGTGSPAFGRVWDLACTGRRRKGLLSSDDLRKTGTERSSRSAYRVLPGGKAHGRCPYREYLFRCPLPPSSRETWKQASHRRHRTQDPCLDPLSAPTQLPVSRTRSRLLSEASCPKPLPIHCPSLATPWLPGHAHTCSVGNLSIFERAFWLVRHHQVYSGVGADIVRESISLIDITD